MCAVVGLTRVCVCAAAAYKHADGKKIDGKRVLVDVERARTVKGWLPRRLGEYRFRVALYILGDVGARSLLTVKENI